MQLDVICTSRGLFSDIFLERGCFWKRCPFQLLYSELLYRELFYVILAQNVGNIIFTLFILYQTLFIDTIFFGLLFYLYRVAPCYQSSTEFDMYVRFIPTFKMFIFTI